MAETVAYRQGMNLGTTFDLQNGIIGMNIFPKQCSSSPLVMEHPSTEIKYSVIKNIQDIGNILEVSAEYTLKILAGIVKAEGIGKYLEEDRFEENTLLILAKAHVETCLVCPICRAVQCLEYPASKLSGDVQCLECRSCRVVQYMECPLSVVSSVVWCCPE